MKRIVSITILALLVAGAAGSVYATSSWEGDADGTCNTYPILVDWVGVLGSTSFIGFWGNDTLNMMEGDVTQSSTYWKKVDGDWNSDGEPYDFYGTWEGTFYNDPPDTNGMAGTWESDNAACTDGNLWGEIDD